METVFKEILKQTGKIIRILTKVTQQYPKLSQEIDLALYAAIKIEKTANKYLESGAANQHIFAPLVNQYKISRNDDNQDAFFTAAMQNIENFKDSTFKLQRKINVLITQQEPHKIKKPTSQSIYPVTNNAEIKMKKKKKSRRDVDHDSQDASSNLSAIDASIVKLVKQIELVMNNQEEKSLFGHNQSQV